MNEPRSLDVVDDLPALRLRGDRRLAITVQWAIIGFTLLLGVMDLRVLGDPARATGLLFGRVLWTVMLFALIRALSAAPDRKRFERALLASLSLTLLGMILVAWLRPPENTSASRLIVMAVFFGYAGLPLPRRTMIAPMLAFTGVYLLVLLTYNTGVPSIERDSIVVAFFAAHVFGGLIAGRREQVLENELALWRANMESRAELVRALDAVRTLEGILPICSYCRRIRDDADKWEPLEQYMHRHARARFSHGLCPDCEVREFPGP